MILNKKGRNVVRIMCQGLLLLITNVSGETIQSDDIPAFETSVMWQIVYEPWHVKAVESHQHFFSKTHVNEGESYTDFVPNMTLPSKINWVSSLAVLPDSFNGHGRTTDLMTTMMLDLDYHSFDTQASAKIDIQLATNPKAKDDWVKVVSESTGDSKSGIQNLFRDVFQDTSDQYEFLIEYKDNKPNVAAVVFYEGAYASIYWMSTIPTERRKGLGTILMINALERIRQRNIRWVVLQAQPLGEGLYRTLDSVVMRCATKELDTQVFSPGELWCML